MWKRVGWAEVNDRQSWWVVPVVLGVLLLSFGLRMLWLTDQSIWYDEAFNILYAQKPWATILKQSVNDTMPPFHYLVLHAWMWIGESEFILKLFSVYAGVLATAVTYAIGRRLLGWQVALGSVLLLAVAPFQVYYAREVRMYSQLLLVSLLSAYAFLRCVGDLEDPSPGAYSRDWRDWALLVGTISLAVYTHTLGFLTPLALGIATLAFRWKKRGFWLRMALSALAVAVLVAPWLLFVLPAQASRVTQTFWVSRPSIIEPVVTLYLLLVGYAIPPSLSFVGLFVTLAITGIALYQIRYHRSKALVLLVLWLFCPIALVWGISQWAPMYLDRVFVGSAPAFYVVLSWGLLRMPRVLRWVLVVTLLGMICLSLGLYYVDDQYHKPPMRDVARYVSEHAAAGDVVLHTGDSSFLTFVYYAPALDQVLAAGDPEHHAGSARAQSLALLGYAAEDADVVASEHDRVWLVVAPDHSAEFQMQLAADLDQRYGGQLMTEFGGIQVLLLQGGRGE